MDGDLFFEYGLAILPLVSAHLLVPPLSYFLGERLNLSPALMEVLDEYYMRRFSYARVRELMLDQSSSATDSEPLCWITYMFVHGDYKHLLNNLQSLVSVGLPVYRHLGAFGLYTVFLAGGIAAPYPSSLRDVQRKRDYNPINHWLGKLTGIKMKICGSSGAIFALFAAGNTFAIFDMLDRSSRGVQAVMLAHRADARSWRQPRQTVLETLRRDLRLLHRHIRFDRLAVVLLNFAHSLSLVQREWLLAAQGKQKYIDNAGHFQGFLAGAAIATLLSLNRWLNSSSSSSSTPSLPPRQWD